MVVAPGARHQAVMGSVRALARREPTFALHVHVGLPDGETGVRVANRMRVHLPLLLALSANSPFWQGRDTGLASARTPLFQAFPRVGIPRPFRDYRAWARAIDLLIRTDTMPDATYIWWDVRPQPRFGTVEVRIMDAQTQLERVGPLVALVQSLARLEATEGFASPVAVEAQEALDENRFLATRDGVHASFVDPDTETRVPVREVLDALMAACAPHAVELGCAAELEALPALAADGADGRQRRVAEERDGLDGVVAALAEEFLGGPSDS
jgi:carboxylate-amine ligase